MGKLFFRLLILVFFISFCSNIVVPQVNVTFVLNTATISDTIRSTSKVTILGNNILLTNWGAGIAMENIGGDYWSKKISFNIGDTLVFTFRVNDGQEYNVDNPYGTGVLSYGLRVFIVGKQDTILPLQFSNFSGITQPQYWKPYPETGSDTLTVWVRVNMQSVMENYTFGWKTTDKDSVAIVGDNLNGATSELDWKAPHYLKKEHYSNFFSGPLHFAKNKINSGDTLSYKFRIGTLDIRSELQGKPNRKFQIPVNKIDTTLAYVYYDNVRPVCRCGYEDTCIVTFNVDMKAAIYSQGFSNGDTVVVRSGFFKTAQEDGRQKQLHILIGSLYRITDTIITAIGKPLNYQYYVIRNGILIRENYFNYQYQGTSDAEQLLRQITVDTKTISVSDNSTVATDARRQPWFPSQIPPVVLTQKEIDSLLQFHQLPKGNLWIYANYYEIYPNTEFKGYGQRMCTGDTLIGGKNYIKIQNWMRDEYFRWDSANANLYFLHVAYGERLYDSLSCTNGVYPLSPYENPILQFGSTQNDTIFGKSIPARNVNYVAYTDYIETYRFSYGLGLKYFGVGGMIGFEYSTLVYAKINGKEYGTNPLAVEKNNDVIPLTFNLFQNYPNPFNPSTVINYELRVSNLVTLKVYDIIGREVATLVNERQEAGIYQTSFNAQGLSSGLYFYQLRTGNYSEVKKMIVLK